jgi:hypothetical protein
MCFPARSNMLGTRSGDEILVDFNEPPNVQLRGTRESAPASCLAAKGQLQASGYQCRAGPLASLRDARFIRQVTADTFLKTGSWVRIP